ncbi:hypothetical protein EX30DRAFT_341296 [Ascodesmis nigricans]|uniref:N-acetyltransferase domain-containing protein n=1 Tax=Ascodesmis nigricans TaxID=341454 RepID=A0A4S2MVJ6_9PEZI|nr:hypothetical protein EX30DRAFT_341296 [Ascodesmis nigricans]
MTSPTPLPPHLLAPLLASDTEIYPSSARLSLSRLESWIDAAPSLSLLFPSGGVIIALPMLASHWKSLVTGELNEWDIDARFLYPETTAAHGGPQPMEIGIHSWHIERNGEPPGFGKRAMEEVKQRVEALGLRITGWSALAVTEDGIGLCRSFGWRERAVEESRGGGRLMWLEGSNWKAPTPAL